MPQSTFLILKGLWGCLSYRRHWQLGLLVFLTLLSSLAEIISLGAIVPFIAAITEPDKVLTYPFVSFIENPINVISS